MARAPAPRSTSSDSTRHALLEAATSVFAAHGYVGGSIRLITRAAGANQAAITYHFGGKDGLYRAVLRAAVSAFEDQSLVSERDIAELDRVEALQRAMRQFLSPLTQRGRLDRYLQIFGWEGVNPSPVYVSFFAEEPPRLFRLMEQLVRRFLPADVSSAEVSLTSFWLIQQPIAVVRNVDRLQRAPYNLVWDEAGVERLVDRLTHLSLGGLTGCPDAIGRAAQPMGNGI